LINSGVTPQSSRATPHTISAEFARQTGQLYELNATHSPLGQIEKSLATGRFRPCWKTFPHISRNSRLTLLLSVVKVEAFDGREKARTRVSTIVPRATERTRKPCSPQQQNAPIAGQILVEARSNRRVRVPILQA